MFIGVLGVSDLGVRGYRLGKCYLGFLEIGVGMSYTLFKPFDGFIN